MKQIKKVIAVIFASMIFSASAYAGVITDYFYYNSDGAVVGYKNVIQDCNYDGEYESFEYGITGGPTVHVVVHTTPCGN